MSLPAHFPTEPKLIWQNFHQINQLPRPSKQEEKMRQFILGEAQKLDLKTKLDDVGNVVVYVPGSEGKENATPVIIQNHMDMVTDALPDRKIDFSHDGIQTLREGDWIKAQGTTLGADNGIGCAAAIALMQDRTLAHPPLEILFTVDEETGLKGAWGVEASFFQGKRLLNLDTEEWGSFYIGCAGGIDYDMEGEVKTMAPAWKNPIYKKVLIKGFLGGHSGVDIHEQRGNAIKFLAEFLNEIPCDQIMVHEIRGGKAHNIIPRDTWALISFDHDQIPMIRNSASVVTDRWKNFLPANDQGFSLELEESDTTELGVTGAELERILSFLMAFPHGAHKYDEASGGELVSLSNNLALCYLVKEKFYVLTSLRFFDRGECVGLEGQVTSLAKLTGLRFKKNGEYPSWKPVRENKLLDQMLSVYERLHGKKPKVTAIHAGLECGILRDKIGPIDAVSFGPTIMGAHSPQERVAISTVAPFWELLKAVLAEV